MVNPQLFFRIYLKYHLEIENIKNIHLQYQVDYCKLVSLDLSKTDRMVH